ncbi:Nudix family hydrolase [Methyloradius palustris]|uniref:Nudix family hydrolase n=1 Tax=Methyloradius palustris TaxID=2778876 RepID=UPI001C8B6A48|nr:Nudix family hydrolase [Methyloradius palustris]
MSTRQTVDAAVGVLRRADGQVLLAQRPEGKPWAGWWEFPGGKIEQGESALAALKRELQEELGIEVLAAYPWLTRSFDYPERQVNLHFFMVRDWSGEPQGCEGQILSWQYPYGLNVSPMLPANAPILSALCLPDVYAITNMQELGEAVFFERLQTALDKELRMIQVREKQLSEAALRTFASKVIALAKPYGAKVLLNSDVELAQALEADGVQINSHQLMQMQTKPEGMIFGASCHNELELAHAKQLGLDFVLLSPVLATQSHPDADTLGWASFSNYLVDYPLPVYALGGMQQEHLLTAWQHGAHGIAMQRAAWISGND